VAFYVLGGCGFCSFCGFCGFCGFAGKTKDPSRIRERSARRRAGFCFPGR
jgi:hypothetical protein